MKKCNCSISSLCRNLYLSELTLKSLSLVLSDCETTLGSYVAPGHNALMHVPSTYEYHNSHQNATFDALNVWMGNRLCFDKVHTRNNIILNTLYQISMKEKSVISLVQQKLGYYISQNWYWLVPYKFQSHDTGGRHFPRIFLLLWCSVIIPHLRQGGFSIGAIAIVWKTSVAPHACLPYGGLRPPAAHRGLR